PEVVVDRHREPDRVAHRRLLQHRLVQRERGGAGGLHADLEQHPLLDLVVTAEEAFERARHVDRLHLGEVAELADVHAEDRGARGSDEIDGAQHRAVASEAHRQVEAVADVVVAVAGADTADTGRDRVGFRDAHLVTVLEQPACGRPRQLVRLEALGVDDEPDDRHQGFLAWTKYSTLPCAPRRGDSIVPMMSAPRAASAPVTSSSVRARIESSRMTPRAFAASRRLASNCGFTSSTRSAPGAAHASSAAATVRSEMKERSATTTSTAPPIDAMSRLRTLVRSRRSTRSSRVSRSWSCPCPTSTAITCRAPRWSRQSVNPPVDAPASSARRPVTSMPKCSSAASSLSPPRLTNRGSPPRSSTGSPGATSRAGLVVGAPATVTCPAAISAAACERLATSPRRTSSLSSRRRAAVTAPQPVDFLAVPEVRLPAAAFFVVRFRAGDFLAGAFLAVFFVVFVAPRARCTALGSCLRRSSICDWSRFTTSRVTTSACASWLRISPRIVSSSRSLFFLLRSTRSLMMVWACSACTSPARTKS